MHNPTGSMEMQVKQAIFQLQIQLLEQQNLFF